MLTCCELLRVAYIESQSKTATVTRVHHCHQKFLCVVANGAASLVAMRFKQSLFAVAKKLCLLCYAFSYPGQIRGYWNAGLLAFLRPWLHVQEAQLPLRNRVSAMHFFVAKLLSIGVMTYSYFYHLPNLRSANLLRTKRINFSMRPQHVRMTRDHTVV